VGKGRGRTGVEEGTGGKISKRNLRWAKGWGEVGQSGWVFKDGGGE